MEREQGLSNQGFVWRRFGVGSEPLTGESAISVPDAGSSIWDAMAGLVRVKNGQHPRQEAEVPGFEDMILRE